MSKRKGKRCKSASPGLGWRCEKQKGHVGFHRAEWAEWSPQEGSTWSGPQQPIEVDPEERLIPEFGEQKFPTFGDAMAAGAMPPSVPTAEQALRDWWHQKAFNETDMVVDKAIEYGATDLIDIGLMLARTMGRMVSEREAAELGVFFYLIGKVSRWQSAIERGRDVSMDTLLDIGVYVRMAQRIRESGGWPGVEGVAQ